MQVVHAGYPVTETGDDIHVPGIRWECCKCPHTKNHGRPTVLFAGVLLAGSVVEIKCPTCNKMTKFRGTSPEYRV